MILDKTLSSWVSQASHLIGDCFDLCKHVLDGNYQGLDPLVRFVSAQLFISCHLSSESSLILIKNGKEWDADLINRSITEGSIKFVYLLYGSPKALKEKATEYWNMLPEIADLKRHKRVMAILEDVDDPESQNNQPYKDLLLSDKTIQEIEAKYDRKFRKFLSQKWSFSEIVKFFSMQDDEGLKALVHLAYTYGMNSHLIHQDGDGVGMIWERYQRNPENRSAVALSHSARIVSDICSFAQFRTFFLLKSCNEELVGIRELGKKYDPLFFEFKKAYSHFIHVEYGDSTR